MNFSVQNYTGPFSFDKNLLPPTLGASKVLDVDDGSRNSRLCFCLEEDCLKVTN